MKLYYIVENYELRILTSIDETAGAGVAVNGAGVAENEATAGND